MSEKAELAEQFLHSYPDSGLTAFVHHVLAEAAYQENDIGDFILHGEEVLLERPETPELLAPLLPSTPRSVRSSRQPTTPTGHCSCWTNWKSQAECPRSSGSPRSMDCGLVPTMLWAVPN